MRTDEDLSFPYAETHYRPTATLNGAIQRYDNFLSEV